MKSKGYDSITSWIAAFACAVIGFLIVVPMRLAGFFFVLIIDQYEVDREKATLPIVVFGMLRSLTGPFIGYLGQTIGHRATTTLGCGLASIGIGVCFFSNDITTVIICLGFIYGLGLGFGVSLIPEILKQHFANSINTPFGIYASGGCIGGIVMPKVLQLLNNEFGNSGMLLILSAIVLNSVPAALILKNPRNDVKFNKSDAKVNDIDTRNESTAIVSVTNDQLEKQTEEISVFGVERIIDLATGFDNKTLNIRENNQNSCDNSNLELNNVTSNIKEDASMHLSSTHYIWEKNENFNENSGFELKNMTSDINEDASMHLPSTHYICEKNTNSYNSSDFKLKNVTSDIKEDASMHLPSLHYTCGKNTNFYDNSNFELKNGTSIIKEKASMHLSSTHHICEKNKNSYDNSDFELKNVTSDIKEDALIHLPLTHYICEKNKNSYDNPSFELKDALSDIKDDASMQVSKVTNQYYAEAKPSKNDGSFASKRGEKEVKINAIYSKSKITAHSKSKKLQSLQLFINPTFYLTMVVQSCHGFVTTLTWTIIVDLGRDRGLSTELSVYFLMFFPIAEMVGSLGLNWITNRGFMSQTLYCMTCYLILSFTEVGLVWFYDFNSMMVCILIFGVFSGSLATTFPGMVFEFFDEDQQSMALTSRFFLYAVLCLTKSPIIGYCRGTLGSYDWVLYIIALSCVSCSILVTFTPLVASWRRRKTSNKCKLIS